MLGQKNRKQKVFLDLEKEKKLIISGDYIDVYLDKNKKGINLIKRTHFLEDFLLEKHSNKYIKEYDNIEGIVLDDKYLAIFGDYIYNNKKIEYNNYYTDCIFVIPTYIEYQDQNLFKRFLCRQRATFEYYLTDFEFFNFHLTPLELEPNLDYNHAYLVFFKYYMYLAVSLNNNFKNIKIIKMSFYEDNIMVDYAKVINFDVQSNMRIPYSNYYVTYNEEEDSLNFLFHRQFSADIFVFDYPLVKNELDITNVKKIQFYDGEKKNLFRIRFFTDKFKIGFFATTEYNLYEVQLEYNQDWSANVIHKWYNPNGNSKGNEQIAYSRHYVALNTVKTKSKLNIFIWKRTAGVLQSYCHTTVGSYNLGSMSYKIADIKMKNVEEKNYLYVLMYDKAFNNSHQYEVLKLKIFEIRNIGLELDLNELKYIEYLRLNFTDIFDENKSVYIEITLKENFKNFLFGMILCILLILMLILIFLIVFVKKSNQELREEVEAHNRNDNLIE